MRAASYFGNQSTNNENGSFTCKLIETRGYGRTQALSEQVEHVFLLLHSLALAYKWDRICIVPRDGHVGFAQDVQTQRGQSASTHSVLEITIVDQVILA